MKYIIYKLTFPYGVHIGNGVLSGTGNIIRADTLFSAVCIEALKTGGEKMLEKFVAIAKKDKLIISDMLPYIGETLYIPKPMYRVEGKEEDISLKKVFKKLEYIPSDKINEYLSGSIDPKLESEKFSKLGSSQLYQKVSVKYDEDNELYSVGVYKFNSGNGLYIIAGFADEETEDFFDTLINSLKYSGIGGKKSAGYGRFDFEKGSLPFENLLDNKSQKYMSLTSCMAGDDELQSVLQGAAYKIIKRSGFIDSQTYSDKEMKKRDFYMFASGAVFEKKFKGDIFDVSIKGGHSVYKYAKPILLSLGGA